MKLTNCPHCGIDLDAVPSRANHVRWCSDHDRSGAKYHLMCSCIECQRTLTVQNLDAHFRTHTKTTPIIWCAQCGVEHNNPHSKFCTRSCAAVYSNARKDWDNIKTGPKPMALSERVPRKKYIKKIKDLHGKPLIATPVKQCAICGKYHPKHGKTCSDECKREYLSYLMKERIKNGWNPNSHRGRRKRSYLETSFSEWLLINFPSLVVSTEHPFRCHEGNKTYFADFFFPTLNLIIELDGAQHKQTTEYDRDRDEYISRLYGVDVVRITHTEYRRKTKLQLIIQLLEGAPIP